MWAEFPEMTVNLAGVWALQLKCDLDNEVKCICGNVRPIEHLKPSTVKHENE